MLSELLEVGRAYPLKKRTWGELTALWVADDIRDAIMDFIAYWSEPTEIRALQLVTWIGLSRSKFYSWRDRYGKANEHNAPAPRDHWLEPWEKVAIISFHHQFPLEGYRRLTFMMLDRDVVAVSPSSTYRVLKAAGLLQRWNPKASRKGNGFQQPLAPHEHWHVDISYLNITGTFFYLCSVLDGCSRFLLHWELCTAMTELDVQIVSQRARERYPGTFPRIITDNGPQFIAKDFKEFIRLAGLTLCQDLSPITRRPTVKSSDGTRASSSIVSGLAVRSQEQDAARLIERFVNYYNTVRLHSAIGYVMPRSRRPLIASLQATEPGKSFLTPV